MLWRLGVLLAAEVALEKALDLRFPLLKSGHASAESLEVGMKGPPDVQEEDDD